MSENHHINRFLKRNKLKPINLENNFHGKSNIQNSRSSSVLYASRSAPNTPAKPIKPGGDRFIPSRTNTDLSHFKINQANKDPDCNQRDYKEGIISDYLHGRDINSVGVLSYQNKEPAEGHMNVLNVVNSQPKTLARPRNIPLQAHLMLDAPDVLNDFYLNLMDWGCCNVLAVALSTSVYLWNADTGAVEPLLSLDDTDDYVTSLSWVPLSNLLAVGTALGPVQLWDASRSKWLRTMNGHRSRVAAMSWNAHVLTTGSRSGLLVHSDVRQKEHIVSAVQSHTKEICGLKWSPDGRYLASGGNDNLLNVYTGVPGQVTHRSEPVYSFRQHQAAVKALDWCPWQTNILASGGGTADKTIKFWNCTDGQCINSVNANSQVSSILWSQTYRELVSAHGFANNQLVIWKYPGMMKVAELTGHTDRILSMAKSPDGSTVMSLGADETLRVWKCFLQDPKKNRLFRHTMADLGLR